MFFLMENCKLNKLKKELYMETLINIYAWNKWIGNRIFHAFTNSDC